MTTIYSIHGLHGKLAALREWDFPVDPKEFWPAFERQAAAALGRRAIRAIRRMHDRSPRGGIVYEVDLVGALRGARRGGGGGRNVYGNCFVTTRTNAAANA